MSPEQFKELERAIYTHRVRLFLLLDALLPSLSLV